MIVVCLALNGRAFAQEEDPSSPREEDTSSAERSSSEQQAAREFDAGLEHFKAAQFEAAARAFLRADIAQPDSDTLINALVAAQKCNEHLLVTEIAQRALDAHRDDPGLIARARAALASAAAHLSLLNLSCSPAPCHLHLDGAPVEAGKIYANPGTHRIAASWDPTRGKGTSNFDERQGNLVAGATYVFDFELEEVKSGTQPASFDDALQRPPAKKPRADRIVFYSAVGLTSALAVGTAISGVVALNAVKHLPDDPSNAEVGSAQRHIERTDVLLGVTAGAALFTVGWGLFGVDFGSRGENVQAGLSLGETLLVHVEGRFQ